MPISSAPPPGATSNAAVNSVTRGTPVTLESLNAQIESLRAMAQDHEVRMLSVEPDRAVPRITEDAEVRALLDSGATHAVIPFRQDMKDLERVGVTLAGDSKEEWFKTNGGTLVVPPPSDGSASDRLQTILPFGALVQTLGCKVSWCKRRGLRVVHPRLGPLKVGVSANTCPYVQEDQALKLIAELETLRLREFEQSVQAMQAELQQITSPCDPTASLKRYVESGDRGQLLRAVFAQPYLKQVPERVKVKLCEELPGLLDQHGWNLLKRLPLCRAKRRSLHSSQHWVVALCSGPIPEGDPLKLWAQERNLEYLAIDVQAPGGRGWDLTVEGGAWSVLLWAAARGRIAAVLSSPPHRSWCPKEESVHTRSAEDPWATSSGDHTVFKESVLAIQDMVLWSIASIARKCAIPFLKEIASASPVRCAGEGVGIRPESFWETETWKIFQRWARVRLISFCQGSLGHSWLCPTVVGTNLSVEHLQGLPRHGSPQPPARGAEAAAQTKWCIGFKKEIVEALDGKVKGVSVEELDRMITLEKENQEAILSCAAEPTSSKPTSSDADEPGHSGSSVSTPDSQDNEADLNLNNTAEVQALKPAEAEAWRAHIMRGHLPYRRDCRFCVEGSGLGVQHRKVKNPKAFTLSVDLFGPMTPLEKGRDEQSVSGNPHLRFGLIGVFRMPKSMLTSKFDVPTEDVDQVKSPSNIFDEMPGFAWRVRPLRTGSGS